MKPQRWFSIVGIVAVAGLLGLLAWGMARAGGIQGSPGVNSQGGIARLPKPKPAPNIQLVLYDQTGSSWQLSDQLGKKVVINFWASWCPPCRAEAGTLEQASKDYKPKNIELVGVNVWDDPAAARRFIAEFGITYANGRDEKNTATVDYGVTGIPETFVVNEEGMITQHWVGPVTRAALDSMVGIASKP